MRSIAQKDRVIISRGEERATRLTPSVLVNGSSTEFSTGVKLLEAITVASAPTIDEHLTLAACLVEVPTLVSLTTGSSINIALTYH